MDMLGHVADAVRDYPGRFTKNTYGSMFWLQEAEHKFEQCSLATTVGAEQSKKSPSLHRQVNILENRNSVERIGEITDLNDWIMHRLPHFVTTGKRAT
jgi:hypothetical protein